MMGRIQRADKLRCKLKAYMRIVYPPVGGNTFSDVIINGNDLNVLLHAKSTSTTVGSVGPFLPEAAKQFTKYRVDACKIVTVTNINSGDAAPPSQDPYWLIITPSTNFDLYLDNQNLRERLFSPNVKWAHIVRNDFAGKQGPLYKVKNYYTTKKAFSFTAVTGDLDFYGDNDGTNTVTSPLNGWNFHVTHTEASAGASSSEIVGHTSVYLTFYTTFMAKRQIIV